MLFGQNKHNLRVTPGTKGGAEMVVCVWARGLCTGGLFKIE